MAPETIAEETVQETPETATETVEQTPEPTTEEGVESEVVEGEETATAETETQAEETDDNWLPQEQTKEFPLEVLAEYAAKRKYGWTDEQIAGDPGLQRFLKDKINADFRIEELRRQVEGDQEETEDGQPLELGEESEDALEQQPTQEKPQPAALTPDAQKQAYYQHIDQLAATLDPTLVEGVGNDILQLFGVNTDISQLQKALADPTLTPEDRMQAQLTLNLAQNAKKNGTQLVKKVVDLVETLSSRRIDAWIEQRYPGTQERYERGLVAESWQQLSDATRKDGKPVYANLPKYGTPDFNKLVVRAEKQLGLKTGGLGRMVLRDDNDRPLPIQQQFLSKLRMVAKVASGQHVTPAVVQQAVQTGKKQAEATAQRHASGRALGAGQPTSSSGRPTGNEDIFGPGVAAYKQRGG